ncbi:MAG: transposase [Acidobacteria bacterium]|nr:transposase [Acidobacteriota bacterium]
MKRDYIEFQDRSVAKGFLITFRCYGTWLHGDQRGSVDRRYYNRYGTQKIAPNTEKEQRRKTLLKHEMFLLGTAERQIVEAAIREVCRVRGYVLIAINVRSNHVHVVVSNSAAPERMMDSFKAYATKELRGSGLVGKDQKVWSRHGSTRYLWSDDHVSAAVEYVVNGQGGELPTLD